jgi:hypothetical protein
MEPPRGHEPLGSIETTPLLPKKTLRSEESGKIQSDRLLGQQLENKPIFRRKASEFLQAIKVGFKIPGIIFSIAISSVKSLRLSAAQQKAVKENLKNKHLI